MATGLIFTADYEVYGNGSGCVEKCVIEPTERMAQILEQRGAVLTLFVDVCEYWAFETEYRRGTLKIDWAGMIKKQLQDLVSRGHDVQLHFHPQWLNYSFDGYKWELDHSLWRISSLKFEDNINPEQGLNRLFAKGKRTLENIIRPVDPDYKCEVFRAGAWSIQPEKDVLKAMRLNNFKIDSTVAPKLNFSDDYTYYDFRDVPFSLSYKIENSVVENNANGDLYELPIYTAKIPFFRRLIFYGLQYIRGLKYKPEGCNGKALSSSRKNKFMKFKNILNQERKMFTFGDATCCEEMKFFVKDGIKKCEGKKSISPVVAISHPKSFANNKEFKKFIDWCVLKNEVNFVSYRYYLG